MDKTKVLKAVVVKVCDNCEKEIPENVKRFAGVDFCPVCYGNPPQWALAHAAEIWQARCNDHHAPWKTLDDLSRGVWVLYEGREDGGLLEKVDSLEKARQAVLSMTEESDPEHRSLVDVFSDGKPMGAQVKMQVKFDNE